MKIEIYGRNIRIGDDHQNDIMMWNNGRFYIWSFNDTPNIMGSNEKFFDSVDRTTLLKTNGVLEKNLSDEIKERNPHLFRRDRRG